MTFVDFILGLLFLAQTGTGVLGNTFLLITCASTSTDQALRPTNLILTNMAVANFLVLLFKGIPWTILTWRGTLMLGNTGCKLVFYMLRVGRGLALCTTCLLSNFQAITISPRAGGRMGLKKRAGQNVSSSCFLCWISNLLINIFVPINIEGLQHVQNSTKIQDCGLCSSNRPGNTVALYTILMPLPDVVFLVLMAGASGYMVLLLYQHRQRVRHIHALRASHRLSPEGEATQTILLLAITFIFFYFTNSFLIICKTAFFRSCFWM
uniref:vomeronasal type-1 receptor 1-like n=1 Tax=Jaculus jaculus TaxID=51337 RepID=UPI001E1B2E1D|nr:vomeronasal type-1 receptor 1-like [Jaculus jaculus]